MRMRGLGVFLSLVSVIVLASPSSGLAQAPEGSCAVCHRALGGRLAAPVEKYGEDVHAAKGFGCVACHGGDARESGLEAMDPSRGYIGVPGHDQVATVCGRCHSDAEFMKRYNPSLRVDQVAEYRISVHGRRLTTLGDPKVATCVSCHPAHAIKPPSEPSSSVHPLRVSETCGSCHASPDYMAEYTISTDQLERYNESIHWEMLSANGDLSAPTCNDCHGNHGAAPPGVSWVGNVCAQCHSVMGELFAKSFHSQIFTLLGTPGCATCHGNHRITAAGDELLGLGEGAACANCHSPTSVGGQKAAAMRALVDSLRTEFEKADSLLSRAERAGMEVSEAQFELNQATSALVSARATIHGFDLEAVRKEVEGGLEITASAYARGQDALEDLRFRRMGLTISVSIIVLFIVGLVLKIRQLERRRSASAD